MPKYGKLTLSDFKKKGNKALTFEERAKRFEEAIKPFSEEFGVNYLAVIHPTQTAITAVCVVVDLLEDKENKNESVA